jgi:hypothetical protein
VRAARALRTKPFTQPGLNQTKRPKIIFQNIINQTIISTHIKNAPPKKPMRFVDRKKELQRLENLTQSKSGGLAILWGRRRVGKTRLLLEWNKKQKGLYTVADQSSEPVQRRYLAESVEQIFPDFAAVDYPNWRALFKALAKTAKAENWQGPLIIDELPYLVAQNKALPSILQAWLDHEAKEAGLVVALAGSAQHMMQDLALDSSAPLYGRATEMMQISPLPAGYMGEAIEKLNPVDVAKAYAVWGGIPKYWELAEPYGNNLEKAVTDLMLDPLGMLHEEPDRLLSREMPPATTLRPLLDAIGAGAHKISEIGGRLGVPASALSDKVSRLASLELIQKEQPFGVSEKSSKKSLYKIKDPFTRTWFSIVAPKRGFLTAANNTARKRLWNKTKQRTFAEGFEQLARAAVPRLPETALGGAHFGPAGRYWQKNGPEWDIVALSEDEDRLLLGEVKWHEKEADEKTVQKEATELLKKGIPNETRWQNLEVTHALFVPKLSKQIRKKKLDSVYLVEAETIISALR